MITRVADWCPSVYVVIDDLSQAVIAPHDHRAGPRGVCSESALITLALVAELTGQDAAGPFLAYVRRNQPTLCPRLPARSRYNRRRRRVIAVTKRLRLALRRRVLRRLDPRERTLCLIDRLPVPVVGVAHARGHHRWYGEAAYGHTATTALSVYGFTLHLLSTQTGVVRSDRQRDGWPARGRSERAVAHRERPADRAGRYSLPQRPFATPLGVAQRPHLAHPAAQQPTR